MTPLFSFARNLTNSDSYVAIQSMVVLRLIMLAVLLVLLVGWNSLIEPFQNWLGTLGLFATVLGWSTFTLFEKSLQTARHSELREILVDVLWVFLFVYLAGRAANPFIYYYLIITAFSAILLVGRTPWLIFTLCGLLYTFILLIDLKNHFSHFSSDYKTHLIGMWINYVASSFVICFFVSKLMGALRAQQKKMTLIRENNLKNEQLIGLATVSASTIHNLASPLSTLTVLIDDLANTQNLAASVSQDVVIMREQIQRCRSTIKELSLLAQKSDEQKKVSAAELIGELKEHCALQFPANLPVFAGNLSPSIAIECNPLLRYAIINLINNAVESAISSVSVSVSAVNNLLRISIKNEVNQSFGQLSEKWGRPTVSSKEFGLGIGSFLANSTIEKQGGTVTLDVTPSAEDAQISLVTVTIEFPIYRVESGEREQ